MPKLDYSAEIILLGSCFSENMGDYFKKSGFKTVTNPFGVIYNPESIHTLLQKMVNNTPFYEHELLPTSNGLGSWLLHSNIGFDNKNELNKWTAEWSAAFKARPKKVFMITLGTAWIYKLIAHDLVCANCHKQDDKKFKKELLSLQQVKKSLQGIVSQILAMNTENQVIFTLSPVRHIKDGFIENMQSKSLLHLGISDTVDFEKVFYFPSYEIIMDELRDYRFYKEDLLHPNKMATDYIWENFKQCCFETETKNLMEKVWNYYQLKNHRVMAKSVAAIDKHNNQILKHKKELRKLSEQIELNYEFDEQ